MECKGWADGDTDPELFPNPGIFDPERWLPSEHDSASGNENSRPHAHQFAFGIGGRMCVASHLAHNALYTVFLHLIAHFRILPAEGESREAIDPLEGLKAKESFVATPRGWRAKFVPREARGIGEWLDGN